MPVEYLTSDSGMPIASRSWALDSTWLAVAGGPTVVSTAPRFAAWCASCRRGKKDRAASLKYWSAKVCRSCQLWGDKKAVREDEENAIVERTERSGR
jgi:hypothetical protein